MDEKREKERRINDYFANNSRTSIRKSSSVLGIPRETVRRFVRKNLKLKPYKMQRLQKLYAADPGKRVAFAKRVIDLNENFTKGIFLVMNQHLALVAKSTPIMFEYGALNDLMTLPMSLSGMLQK